MKVAVKIIVGLLIMLTIGIAIKWLSQKYSDMYYIEECENRYSYKYPIAIEAYDQSKIVGSTIISSDKITDKLIDSAEIKFFNINIPDKFELEKGLPINTNWKLKFKDDVLPNSPKFLLITDIETRSYQERTMFGHVNFCEIHRWKVNGVQYSVANGDVFILGRK